MFKKILVANRGEIACRVIRTARRLGVKTVAVYSEADKDALHVLSADEAVCIGPATSAQSYLSIDNIVRACRETGAEAVHPGYGFLSENAAFVERLEREGIVFIGPTSQAIVSMGDKITAKRLAAEAGVNVIAGCYDEIENADHAVRVANEIGYPVMLKASAGGGGKGMRIANSDDECRDGFERATGEARSAFGDGRVFIEKYVAQPRHIEIQVLADAHGGAIHLGERECSLQRRHQKVIEEAPSPFLDEKTRAAMGDQALALARAVNYRSAGTVEFLVDADRNFYFLEMNTRLQVEHPVTEFVTGLDLVELMIRIACGEKLPLSQADVKLNGWAIEARVYAEDPFRNFLPSIGRLVRYLPPAESEGVRVDTGVNEGHEVSMHYDPLIAKLITHGATRDRAIERMRGALNEFYLRGVSHNISFLASLIENRRFREGRLSTDLIASEYPQGFHAADVVHDDPALLIVVAAAIHRRYMDRAAQISGQLPGYERKVNTSWVVVMGERQHHVEASPLEGGQRVVYQPVGWDSVPTDPQLLGGKTQPMEDCSAEKGGLAPGPAGKRLAIESVEGACPPFSAGDGGETYDVLSDWQFGQPLFRGTVNGAPVCMQVERRNMIYRLFHWGAQVDLMVLTGRAAELLASMPKKAPPDMSKFLRSPMPGLLSQLLVAAGDEVKIGQRLAVVEAMKMENVLLAERDGKVARTLAAVGDTLAVDQAILEFES
jgi:propionyl-CoA carboxylase alpha chain